MTVFHVRNCPICRSADFSEIMAIERTPKFHVISIATELSDDLFGKVRLVECEFCGHLFNNAVEINEVNPGHGSYSTNAPVSQSMFDRRQQTLEFLSGNGEKKLAVLEVGGGSGALSAAFAESKNSVTMLEPELIVDTARLEKLGVRIIQDVWPTDQLLGEKFDLILCVQVLEHTARPREFLLELAKHLRDSGKIYMEVPSGDWVKKHGSAADVHYPHWNYFTESIVQKLVAECELNILKRRELISGRDIGYVLQNQIHKSDYSVKAPFQNFENTKLTKSLKYAQRKIDSWNGNIKYAFYGSTSQSQAAFGSVSGCQPNFIFDDTSSYHGAVAYNSEFRFPIVQLTAQNLAAVDVIVISSYIHDQSISEKIRDIGFTGEIYSLRPPSDPSGKVKSLFGKN